MTSSLLCRLRVRAEEEIPDSSSDGHGDHHPAIIGHEQQPFPPFMLACGTLYVLTRWLASSHFHIYIFATAEL